MNTKPNNYKNINSSGMKSGGCKCGCQAITSSNHPDPFKIKEKKKTKRSKSLPIFSHKDIKNKINKINDY